MLGSLHRLHSAYGKSGSDGSARVSASGGGAAGEAIVILDMGSQTAMLIARRVRELNVYCELLPPTISRDAIRHLNPKGVILSGGPASVHDADAPRAPDWAIDGGLPVLGICYGMQEMAHRLGGSVAKSAEREFGPASLGRNGANPLFAGIPDPMDVWMSHGDHVDALPAGFVSTAGTDGIAVAAMKDATDKRFGIQFHPEVVHTPRGTDLLANFVHEICGCRGGWTADHFVTASIEQIRKQVGKGRVLCALSGGVDSAVAAALAHRAIGDQLTCVFVDNGLMRLGELEQVAATLRGAMNIDLRTVDAGSEFLEALAGVADPEAKRKRVGETFITVFEEAAREIGEVDFLLQGTTYPDVVESAGVGHKSAAIKSHHNVGGLPEHMRFELVEPLKYLFKDEVRSAGRELGLPAEIVDRQPYPGPGLSIRISGEVTRERVRILQLADAIVLDEVRSAGLYDDLWQSFAILTDTRTVGVQGDARTYGRVVAIRAVTADDAMTADWARLPHDVLARISSRIVNEIPEVNRVVYDITSKPPGTIEWE